MGFSDAFRELHGRMYRESPAAGAVSAIILGAQVPVAGKLTGRESGAFCK
jgi:hypothetical protein